MTSLPVDVVLCALCSAACEGLLWKTDDKNTLAILEFAAKGFRFAFYAQLAFAVVSALHGDIR